MARRSRERGSVPAPKEVLALLDAHVRRALERLDEEGRTRLLLLVRQELPECESLDTRRARAVLLGTTPQHYCDCLAGRRGSHGTALLWTLRWSQTISHGRLGLPPFDLAAACLPDTREMPASPSLIHPS